MSSKLVKKLLQQTGELEQLGTQRNDDDKTKSKKRKRPAAADSDAQEVVNKKDLLQLHIQSMIRMDRTISSRGKHVSKQSKDRVEGERKKKSKLQTKALQVDGGVGNSRGSSYQKSHEHHEPTYNKKRHEAEKKEKMLRDIAQVMNARLL